jgi:tetratricopeptide (TPR) repeat protein
MLVPQKKELLKARAFERCSLLRIYLLGFFILIAGIPVIGSSSKKAQGSVSKEDVARANEALNEGDIAFSRKDYYAALIKYLEAARINPQSEYLYNRLGIAYSQLKFYGEATTAFRRSIKLNPKYPFAYNNLGSVFFAQTNLRKAEKYFKKAINLKEDEASFHMNLGSLYLERKKKDKAMAEWQRSLALDPGIFSKRSAASLASSGGSLMERYYFLARIFASSGNVESAIENLKLAITQGFNDIESINKQRDFDPVRKDERFVEFIQSAALLIKLQSKVGLPVGESPGFPPR